MPEPQGDHERIKHMAFSNLEITTHRQPQAYVQFNGMLLAAPPGPLPPQAGSGLGTVLN